MNSKQIREKFLQYFESKNHQRVRSSSLIPSNDPTLFFTNAGMVQFKNLFLGLEKASYKRATTSQKCMRVSGKHNDLENVGRTHRHHTFFEMLGNFSFGDYFKKDAIHYAWEFLTKVMNLPKDRLWVTVFREDDEAAALWEKEIGIDPKRIIRLGEKDNFWSMGEEGPCGPCTEIHYDFRVKFEETEESFLKAADSGEVVEIWNLVFMQYNRSADGTMEDLPKPSVDTGMGLERLACVVQGKLSNYECDLFTPLISRIEELVGKKCGVNEATTVSIRVLADHIRATAFLIGDGVQPANEGRGYVLRRIMRRAIRHGRMLGQNQPFFYKLLDTLVAEMGEAYPELIKHKTFIESVIKAEEERFLTTLEKGLEMIEAEKQKLKQSGEKCFAGDIVFKLYDTFGFPVDLIQNIADEEGYIVDMEGFEEAMLTQKQSARRAWRGSGQEKVAQVYQELAKHFPPTKFLGYESLEADSKMLAMVRNGEKINEAKVGDQIYLLAEQTPFYGESGGQVGDVGTLSGRNFKIQIEDTQKPVPDYVVHIGKVTQGFVKTGDLIHLSVDAKFRTPTQLNHTATHLLHAALRQVLGDHVRQAGSQVAPHRLRFDFSHFEPLTDEQVEKIESIVNQKIRESIPVAKKEMAYDEAISTGAMALFGEKYGDKVRVLSVGDFSTELCGGTHIDHTGEIGFFKIVEETSVAAGVRRIEAVTGQDALQYCRKLERQLKQLAQQLKVGVSDLPEKLNKLSEQTKKMEKEIAALRKKLLSGDSAADTAQDIREKNGAKFLATKVEAEDINSLRAYSDQLLAKLGNGVLLLSAAMEGKVTLIVRVSKELCSQYKAGEIIKPLAEIIGGSGGGRPDMAQAGGTHVEKIEEALKKFYEIMK
ncbi:MAG: alanine--tRNA ligase [Deltaproteobacteria bacterium]|nr:alanine--tRNA ligase [Deltaproteobacteria bacterium]